VSAEPGAGHGNALTQSCPDFATRNPFPFKIVFEGKYFEKGGRDKATTELVTSIYQAFFYRGLPYDSSRKNGPGLGLRICLYVGWRRF
jgi:hypothetical protein